MKVINFRYDLTLRQLLHLIVRRTLREKVQPRTRGMVNAYWQSLADHYALCAEVEDAKALEANINAQYYRSRNLTARNHIKE